MSKKAVITVTFGDSGENHVGNQQIGEKVPEGQGFTLSDFEKTRDLIEAKYPSANVVIYNLKDLLMNNIGEKNTIETIRQDMLDYIPDSVLIVIENLVSTELANNIETELSSLEWDTKYWDTRRKRVLNKRARSNLCFDRVEQEPDYENGKGRIVSFNRLPNLDEVKRMIGDIFGEKGQNLIGEGNRYPDRTKNGIGFHGDAERLKVVALRLNQEDADGDRGTMPICWQWFHRSKSIGEKFTLNIKHGSIYAMSEYTTGYNWKRSSLYTLRHAAGGKKYTTLKK
tara:strand:+ start:109 stop:960 length:852 start_codon:yes stop_codon:yes gene_type:complete